MFLFFVIHDLIFIEINAFNNALSLINWNECNPLIDVIFLVARRYAGTAANTNKFIVKTLRIITENEHDAMQLCM